METAIQVIWWTGLVVALLATLVILKQVAVTLRTLRHIHELAGHTREAARNLANHLEAARELDGLTMPAARLVKAAGATTAAAGVLRRRLEALAAGPRGG